MTSLLKHTKIVCTIGPATNSVAKLASLVEAGMNVCRLNFSHGTHEEHAELIRKIRKVAKKTGEPLAILQDLQGPKIRIGELPKEGILLEQGKEIVFTTGTPDIPSKLPVTYASLHADVKPGQHLLLDDGLIVVQVKDVRDRDVLCDVIHGGKLTSHKGLNLPETNTSISAMSEKDRDDLRFGVEQEVDWIALSFVRSTQDIQELRMLIQSAPIRLMAKIEKPEAIEKFDEILCAVDGIMVARGDLGIEMPAEKVPVLQKMMVEKCLSAGKPVIVATQMLHSMTHNPQPTRAEVSDVANAVIDHADATMLSGETAMGEFPIEAVHMMASTIRETEVSAYDDLPIRIEKDRQGKALSNVASILAKISQASAILVVSFSGESVASVCRYRPELPIYAVFGDQRSMRQANLLWGVRPFVLENKGSISDLISSSLAFLKKQKKIQSRDQIILVAGDSLEKNGSVQLVELRTI